MSSVCHRWIALLLLASCATAPPAPATRPEPTLQRPRAGVVESLDEIEEHAASTAGSKAVLGILLGGLLFSGLLFHHGTGILVGAEDGGPRLATSDGVSTALPRYRVHVRFDDGGEMTLVYTDDVPFHRGERVVLTQQGLVGARAREARINATERRPREGSRTSRGPNA